MVEKLSWEARLNRRWRWCGCRIVESVSHLSLWKRCSFPMLASRQEPHATSKGRVLDSPLPARCLRRKGGASGLKAAWGKVHAFTSLSHLRTSCKTIRGSICQEGHGSVYCSACLHLIYRSSGSEDAEVEGELPPKE